MFTFKETPRLLKVVKVADEKLPLKHIVIRLCTESNVGVIGRYLIIVRWAFQNVQNWVGTAQKRP